MELENQIKYLEGKLEAAKASLKFRQESERCWRGGTDASWRKVGCFKNKSDRLRTADLHGRIAVKVKAEIEMLEQILKRMSE